ncbi:ADP-ribosylation factor-like protein 2 [Sporobolomyces salmoneus]|uniref:ADP-ribosylation factor-like protein 2 n=1 Tax=Sporobolomyces salmoneus TaxID=183962 RepID=UPI00317CF6C2
MGLLTIIRKTRLKEKQIRILMLGLDNAGKTTICKSILHEDVSTISPTLGFNIRTIVHSGYTLNVWDIGGQTSLRPYWKNYFEQTDAVVWVVDSSDRERMRDCRNELHELLKQERLMGASLLVFANKQDIPNSMTPSEISAALELESLTSSHKWTIQPCSARYSSPSQASSTNSSGTNGTIEGKAQSETDPRILEGLDWVVKEVAGRVYYGTTPPSPALGASTTTTAAGTTIAA